MTPSQEARERTAEQIEAARKLFAGPCDFVAGAGSLESLIPIALILLLGGAAVARKARAIA